MTDKKIRMECEFQVASHMQRTRKDLQEIIDIARRALKALETCEPSKRVPDGSELNVFTMVDLVTGIKDRALFNTGVLRVLDEPFRHSTPEGALYLKSMITGCDGPSSEYQYEDIPGTQMTYIDGSRGPRRRLARTIDRMPGRPDKVTVHPVEQVRS